VFDRSDIALFLLTAVKVFHLISLQQSY